MSHPEAAETDLRIRGLVRALRPAAAGRSLGCLALAAMACAGCASVEPRNEDLARLLKAYRSHSQEAEARQRRYEHRGIRRLEVRHGEGSDPILVDAELVDARLPVVIDRMLAEAGLGFVVRSGFLGGRVSARFEARPIDQALDALLGPAGLEARLDDGMVVVDERRPDQPERRPATASGGEAPDAEDDDGGGEDEDDEDKPDEDHGDEDGEEPKVGGAAGEERAIELPLRFLIPQQAGELLAELIPVDEDSEARPVLFAPRASTNSIVLAGGARDVERVMRLLRRLDSDPGHVLIEALVVEFEVNSFLDIGSRLSEGSSGEFSDVFIDFADLVGDTISFTRVADAANTDAFAAVLNLLIQKEKARVISRPYLATISGDAAELEVSEDRYVLSELAGSFDPVSLERISSGVKMLITPTVSHDGMIRLEIEVEQSQFIPSLENVSQRLARNRVRKVARVRDGETVIIGGLMLDRRAESKAGIPILRELPPFSFFFGHKDRVEQKTQVMIYVTPHLWTPGMSTPLLEAQEWDIYDPEEGQTQDNASDEARP